MTTNNIITINKTVNSRRDIRESLVITCFGLQGEVENHVFPLSDTHVFFDNTQCRVRVDIPISFDQQFGEKPLFQRKYKRVVFCYTDDAKIYWAGDWTNMGCFPVTIRGGGRLSGDSGDCFGWVRDS